MKIAQVIYANSWGDVTPEALERGIGGREGALIRLATEWAKLGHEVTNFVPTQTPRRFEEYKPFDIDKEITTEELDLWRRGPGFHEYVNVGLAKPMLATFPYDAVVAWECPQVFDSEAVMEKQPVRLVHMQVAHLEDHDSALNCSTGVVALSEWAKQFLIHEGLDHPNMYVRPNGVNIADYPIKEASRGTSRSPGPLTLVYSSSPDRGLWHLLKLWPAIRKKFGNGSRLLVAYGVHKYTENVRWAHSRIGEMSVQIERLMEQPGVIDVGKIGQKQLARLQMKSNIWVYPADTIQATETGCITAIENMAAGNPCVMSDADCLEAEFKDVSIIVPLPFEEWTYIDAIEEAASPDRTGELALAGREFAETRDWSKIAPTWIDLFKENADG